MTQNTEDRILDAAQRLFAERGYAATTTRAIAEYGRSQRSDALSPVR